MRAKRLQKNLSGARKHSVHAFLMFDASLALIYFFIAKTMKYGQQLVRGNVASSVVDLVRVDGLGQVLAFLG